MRDRVGALRQRYAAWTRKASEASSSVLASRYLGTAVYGSVGRDTPHDTSDIDLLVLARDLPEGRMARARLAETIDAAFRVVADEEAPELSILLRTPEELQHGFPLVLEIAMDGRIVDDPEGLLARQLTAWREHLALAGARRIRSGDFWHWDLQGDARAGEWEI